MGVLSGLLMIGTSDFSSSFDYIGTIIIILGAALIIKKQYIDAQYWYLFHIFYSYPLLYILVRFNLIIYSGWYWR